MKALSIEHACPIGADAEVGVGAEAGENEKQRRRTGLAIECKAYVTASFERRQIVSAGEPGHMEDARVSARRGAVDTQDSGGRGRQVGVVIRIIVVRSLDRAGQQTQRGQYRENKTKAHGKN